MRTDLDHLPAGKRRELAHVVRVLFEEFEDALRLATGRKKQGRILKIVLFGSYARGGWVADRQSGYLSDYDLLVVVSRQELTDPELWRHAEDRLLRDLTVTRRLSAPVNFIVHTLGDVNDQLARGRYFFSDIVKEGIALYEAEGRKFLKPEPLSEAAARAEAQAFFDEWYSSAEAFRRGAGFYISEGRPKEAAFSFHQAAERLYHCVLLVLTLYSPPSHKLNFLRSQAERLDPRLIEAWPRETKLDRRRFELLRRAYVEARYSPHYKISAEELAWLGERVEVLQELVRQVCEERLGAA